MNPWDVVTWVSAFALAGSALWIFVLFTRDARSIFDREMHDQDPEPDDGSALDPAAEGSRPTSPEDPPR